LRNSVPPGAPRTLSAAPPPIEDDKTPLQVIVVDDDATLRRQLARLFTARGMHVLTAEDGLTALEQIDRHQPDVALIDLRMPGMDGFEVLAAMRERALNCEAIMMTAYPDVDVAVRAVKSGAHHFLQKPFASADQVVLAVTKAADHKRLAERASKLEQRLLSQERFGELVGTSPKMESVYRIIDGVANTRSTVLVLGESGTGKELVARAIHQRSSRADKPFVPVNCAAIPKELVESELFGHVRGAFTGANAARAGLFESANGGTIFLDEVGDLPLAAQVKLLRTLQEGEVKRVGSDEAKTVDVRVLAATNVDLNERIGLGTFRIDLYYRLNVISVQLPALRERGDDIQMLAYHFLQKLARRMERPPKRLSSESLKVLREYAWPGNVRELEHALERAFILCHSDVIQPSDLPFGKALPDRDARRRSDPKSASALRIEALVDLPYPEAKKRVLELFDAEYTMELMRRTDGNLSEAARQAGMDRSNFRRLIKRPRAGGPNSNK
jgi:DNA-binding NtrC family response regulator